MSKSLCQHTQRWAENSHRPYQYVGSARASKEQIAEQIALRDHIQEGLVCVLGLRLVRSPELHDAKLKRE